MTAPVALRVSAASQLPVVSQILRKGVRETFALSHPHLRYIEWKGVKVYDFQKVTFSTLFKLYIAGLGVLIQKRYDMLG